MAEEQVTLRDQLASALENVEPIENTVQPAASEATADVRARDEAGRFARAEERRVEAARTAVTDPAAATQPIEPQRPSTWKKEHWERFDKLDPETKSYILQRENEYKAGISTYRGEVESSKTLKQAIEPFMPSLQAHNIDPAQWIRNLGNAHQTLALGSPQAKYQVFMQLARDYGVPLQGMQQGQQPQMDPNLQYVVQNLQGLQQWRQQFETKQQQQEQQQINSTIQDFVADTAQHPHFEAVRETMAGLLQSGNAQNLQEAYEKAIWIDPDIRTQVLAAQQQQTQAATVGQKRAAVAQARAKAISPRGVTPGVSTTTANGKKGLRDQIAEQFSGLDARV
jgi:hypothetical protein